MEKKKFKLGLVPKLIIAIIIGILFGQFLPTGFCRFVVTLSGFFSTYLKFIIPLMILAYVTMGIADLSQGAGQLLLITVALAYGSTLLAGTASYLVSSNLFPHFMTAGALDQIAATADASLKPYFSLTITPLFDTLSAVVLAFILGLCLSTMKGKEIGNSLYNGMSDFSTIIDKVLHKTIIPLLPLYICGTFTDMTKSGKTFAILGILWKVFLVVIIMHFVCITIQFIIAGSVSKKNPLSLIKNQVPGYTTALGTQSSAATIPVNLECAKNDGVSAQIRNFVVPLCANIHMAGSMITITACATAVCLMNQLPISLATVIPFIMTLGVAMVASPGAPGGSIMTALPFLYMVFGTTAGDTNGPICALMVALYITQDSFGTACNISGDNAIGIVVDSIYKKFILKEDTEILDEVVVTGYQTLRKSDVVGSVSTVKASDIMMPVYTSVDQMLQGRVAGMMVMNTSSRVGTSPKIRIRGTSTILGNQDPLWVVDGVIQPDPIPLNQNDLMVDDLKNILGNQISWLNPASPG